MVGLNLERYAALSAAMARGTPKDRALAEAGVSEADWDVAQTYWLAKMADGAEKQRFALTARYNALYMAALRPPAPAPPRPAAPRRSDSAPRVVIAPMPSPLPSPMAPAPTGAPPAPGAVAPPPRLTPAPARLTPAPPAYTTKLSVEQFAAMRAEIVVTPEAEHAEVRARFGLDASVADQEEAEWQRRLAADKELFSRYVARFQYFRALLQPR